MRPITIDKTYSLLAAERTLIEAALAEARSIVNAAVLLGITRHSLKRRIVKHGIRWQSTHPAHGPRFSEDT